MDPAVRGESADHTKCRADASEIWHCHWCRWAWSILPYGRMHLSTSEKTPRLAPPTTFNVLAFESFLILLKVSLFDQLLRSLSSCVTWKNGSNSWSSNIFDAQGPFFIINIKVIISQAFKLIPAYSVRFFKIKFPTNSHYEKIVYTLSEWPTLLAYGISFGAVKSLHLK